MHQSSPHGTLKDPHDRRDLVYAPGRRRDLPPQVDLSHRCPPVYHQKKLNSCSANALAAAVWLAESAETRRPVPASRLFIYYNERAREGTVATRAPVALRDGFKTLVRQGVCPESMWPYLVRNFAQRPPHACYRAAVRRKALVYQRIHQELPHLKACLADGYAFIVAMAVYKGFESKATARTGLVPRPARSEQPIGGHAVLVVGYSDRRSAFFVRNSWGRQWGLNGYFWLPYRFALDPDFAWDFWTLRAIE